MFAHYVRSWLGPSGGGTGDVNRVGSTSMVGVRKRGQLPPAGRGVRVALVMSSFLALAGCNPATMSQTHTNPDVDVIDKVRSIDILPRYPTQTGTTTTSAGQRAQ